MKEIRIGRGMKAKYKIIKVSQEWQVGHTFNSRTLEVEAGDLFVYTVNTTQYDPVLKSQKTKTKQQKPRLSKLKRNVDEIRRQMSSEYEINAEKS